MYSTYNHPSLKSLILHRRYALLALGIIIALYLYSTRSSFTPPSTSSSKSSLQSSSGVTGPTTSTPHPPTETPSIFAPGTPKPVGSKYSQTLVVAATKEEDVDWLDRDLPDVHKAIYVADDQNATLHPPSNKGHEAMNYLTYMIDNYHDLPDVSIFIHAHQVTWHNNDAMDSDTAVMVKRLSNEHVFRQGYFNLRCHWKPGCPDNLWEYAEGEAQNSEEKTAFTKAWSELQPGTPLPKNLSQPCCAQFALSRQRILSVPLKRLVDFQSWLAATDLTDNISGRIFEHTWQFIFTGETVYCPEMHVCYCDGYGICFGSKGAYQDWSDLKEQQLSVMKKAEQMDDSEEEEKRKLHEYSDKLGRTIERDEDRALERGKDPAKRAEEVGRPWKEGDGF